MDVEHDERSGTASDRWPLPRSERAGQVPELHAALAALEWSAELLGHLRAGRLQPAVERLAAVCGATRVTARSAASQALIEAPGRAAEPHAELVVPVADVLVWMEVPLARAAAARGLLTALAALSAVPAGGHATGEAADSAAAIDAWASTLGASPRLREVARLRARGHTERQIADQLGITWRTARTYVERLYRTVGVRSHAELVHHALEQRGRRGARLGG